MTSDGDALFRTICQQPWEDTPRLVYADWLEENGRPERAEFIRLQCEAWNLCPQYETVEEARTRASALLKKFGDEWYNELPEILGLRWGSLFVRGFIDTAWVPATENRREILTAAFAAAPLQRLGWLSLTPEEERDLAPLLSRLNPPADVVPSEQADQEPALDPAMVA